MEHQNYYQVLKCCKCATQDEIKASYRSLAKKYHPDVNKGSALAEQKFKEITNAYATLGNIQKRKQYDVQIANKPQANADVATYKQRSSQPVSKPQYTSTVRTKPKYGNKRDVPFKNPSEHENTGNGIIIFFGVLLIVMFLLASCAVFFNDVTACNIGESTMFIGLFLFTSLGAFGLMYLFMHNSGGCDVCDEFEPV